MEAEINDLKQDVDDLETALKKVCHGIYYAGILRENNAKRQDKFCIYQERSSQFQVAFVNVMIADTWQACQCCGGKCRDNLSLIRPCFTGRTRHCKQRKER